MVAFSESPAKVAQLVGTDANTVKTTRYSIRKKAKAWGKAASEPNPSANGKQTAGVEA